MPAGKSPISIFSATRFVELARCKYALALDSMPGVDTFRALAGNELQPAGLYQRGPLRHPPRPAQGTWPPRRKVDSAFAAAVDYLRARTMHDELIDRRGLIDLNLSNLFPGHDDRMEAHRLRIEAYLATHPADDYNDRKAAARRQMQERAIELRKQGMKLQEIADELGTCLATVGKYLKAEVA